MGGDAPRLRPDRPEREVCSSPVGVALALALPPLVLLGGFALGGFGWPLVALAAASALPAPLLAWRGERARSARLQRRYDSLAEEQRLLRESIEITPTPFALYDAEDRLIAWNPSYEGAHAVDFDSLPRPIRYEDLIRASLPAMLPAGEAERHIEERLRLHREADGQVTERAYPNGRWLQITKQRTPSGGVAGFAADVTALHEAKQAAELASRSKSEFLAMMSHELRTPLNAIIGFAEMLHLEVLGPLGNPRYRSYAGDIQRSGVHLLAVINQILDLAKVEAGKLELREQAVDLQALLQEAAAMMEPRSRQAKVTLRLDPVEPLPQLRADPARLLQVLTNLLSNAVKFTPEGGEVRLEVLQEAEGLTLRVSDTGVGIAPEDLERVLQPFTQAGSILTPVREGTGLGLPLAKRLVEAHGGRLRIDSLPGRGTSVSVHLPASRLLASAA